MRQLYHCNIPNENFNIVLFKVVFIKAFKGRATKEIYLIKKYYYVVYFVNKYLKKIGLFP